jgi:hypothetical protein
MRGRALAGLRGRQMFGRLSYHRLSSQGFT